MRANLRLVKPAPTFVNGTVPPKRVCNKDVRPREYLTPKEVEKLTKASRTLRRSRCAGYPGHLPARAQGLGACRAAVGPG
jgi:hypothetical protein